MTLRRSSLLVVLLALLASCIPSSAALQSIRRDTWIGIRMGGARAGYTHLTVRPYKFEGQDAYRIDTENKIQFAARGLKSRVESTSTEYLDETFRPVYETERTTTRTPMGDEDTAIETRYSPASVHCKSTRNGTVTERTIPIPAKCDLSVRSKWELGLTKLSVGQKLEFQDFDADELAFPPNSIEVLKRESVELGGKRYDAVVSLEKDPQIEMRMWRMDNGDILKYEVADMDILAFRETRQEATSKTEGAELSPSTISKWGYGEPIHANVELPHWQYVGDITVEFTGIPDTYAAITDSRQGAKPSPDGKTLQYSVLARTIDSSKSATLPIKDTKLRKWLGSDEAVQADDKRIKALAKSISAGSTDAYQIARKTRAWVFDNMEPVMQSPTPLTASGILKAKTGDCKHYSVLYMALARAAGIPTRYVVGLMFDGRDFCYHAWAESYVGEWVPMDPTLPDDYVPATHIKLAQDNPLDATRASREGEKIAARITGCWPLRIDPCSTEPNLPVPDGAVGVRWAEDQSIYLFAPGTRSLTVPKSRSVTDAATNKTYRNLKPGAMVLIPPTGCAYVCSPGSRLLTGEALAQAIKPVTDKTSEPSYSIDGAPRPLEGD